MTSLQEAFAFSEGKRGLCLVLRDYVTRIMDYYLLNLLPPPGPPYLGEGGGGLPAS